MQFQYKKIDLFILRIIIIKLFRCFLFSIKITFTSVGIVLSCFGNSENYDDYKNFFLSDLNIFINKIVKILMKFLLKESFKKMNNDKKWKPLCSNLK